MPGAVLTKYPLELGARRVAAVEGREAIATGVGARARVVP